MTSARTPLAAAAAWLLVLLAAPSAEAADPWPGGPVSTVGKIVWDAGGGRLGVCSGALVDAPNGSVVATAAHCVRTKDHPEPPPDAYFVPGYDHDAETYRRDGWPVVAHHTPAGWDVTRETAEILPHDYAFLTLGERNGRTAQEVHGANRLVFEPVPEGQAVTVLGYPAVAPYDGESLYHCRGETDVLTEAEAHAPNVGGLWLTGCDMTAGSSGGPWLTDFDAGAGSGTLVAVMSVGSGRGDVVGRPYPETARALFEAAGTP
jgi:V8-like Glu-specific endopeptidase